MEDKFGLDAHKLNYHPRRIADWLEAGDDWEKAKKIYPIYIEISPCGFCNHRCSFCALDFMGYKKLFLDADILKRRIEEMAEAGVKSIMFAGEGESLLHRKMAEIAICAKYAGIDTAFTTNGSMLKEKFCYETLSVSAIEWIKVSINAATAGTYQRIHGVSENQFAVVLSNIGNAVKIKEELKSSCVIGSQMLLLPENWQEAPVLAAIMRDLGCDYLVIKPHSQHPLSIGKGYENINYDNFDLVWLKENLDKFNSGDFKVIFRSEAFSRSHDKQYSFCYSVPFFWAYITASGDVYACSMFLGDERFLLGNIYRSSLKEIWEGEKRRQNWLLLKNFFAGNCRKNCRMDVCNLFLEKIKNPPPHVNFI